LGRRSLNKINGTITGVSLTFSAGGDWFSQVGKTIKTELLYKTTLLN